MERAKSFEVFVTSVRGEALSDRLMVVLAEEYDILFAKLEATEREYYGLLRKVYGGEGDSCL